MGRSRSYRERIKFETLSVESKSLKNLLSQELREDFGLSRLEADVLALRSIIWLQDMIDGPLPGQLLLSVPATPYKKDALSKRTGCTLTVVDINSDGEIWREYGLCVMQRGRALRLLYEAWRQGGWFSYSELSSLLNLTPTALSNRLRSLKEFGVWLPHVGGPPPLYTLYTLHTGGNSGSSSGSSGSSSDTDTDIRNYFHSVLLKSYLDGVSSETLRKLFGLTVGEFELVLRGAVMIWELQGDGYGNYGNGEGIGIGQISKIVGLKSEEVESILSMVAEYCKKKSWQDLYQSYRIKNKKEGEGEGEGAFVSFSSDENGGNNGDKNKELKKENLDLLDILEKEHGLPLIVSRIYLRRLRELADRLNAENSKKEGETIFFAISSDEGPRTRLSEGKIVPVYLKYFSEDDHQLGPRGCHKNRVSDLKFARILRYTTQTREQGGLLSIPDVAMLMGIGIDAVRRLIKANGQIVIPTRGLIKDMGRSISHKCKIVELYLQMYTETEIVERTGHCYESIESYLKEFARVLTLADQGLNAVMIRRVTGRSMSLVKSYLDLYQKYDGDPDYVFRIEHLKNVFAKFAKEEEENKVGAKAEKAEDELKKKSPLSLSLPERNTDE